MGAHSAMSRVDVAANRAEFSENGCMEIQPNGPIEQFDDYKGNGTMNSTEFLPNVSNSSFYGKAKAGKITRSYLLKNVYNLVLEEYM